MEGSITEFLLNRGWIRDQINRLDPECVKLCVALNKLPGIRTTESCCGHGKEKFHIWFDVTDWNARGMILLARLTCNRYYEFAQDWMIRLYHGDQNPVSFLLEGSVGIDGDALADEIMAHIERRPMPFNILYTNTSFEE